MLLIPAFMESMLERTATPVVRNRIKRMWDYMVEQMLHLEVVGDTLRGGGSCAAQ